MDTRKIQKIAMQIAMLAESLAAEFATELAPNTQQEVDDLVAKGICLVCKRPFKPKQKRVRGAHEHCKKEVLNLYSDEKLVESGILLAAKPGGRPSSAIDKVSIDKRLNPQSLVQSQSKRKNKD